MVQVDLAVSWHQSLDISEMFYLFLMLRAKSDDI